MHRHMRRIDQVRGDQADPVLLNPAIQLGRRLALGGADMRISGR